RHRMHAHLRLAGTRQRLGDVVDPQKVGRAVTLEAQRAQAESAYCKSSACCFSASSGMIASVSSCVAASTTGAATPASYACRHVAAHTHQRSPGLRPGKPNCGAGETRSLPCFRAKSRNARVTWVQTT